MVAAFTNMTSVIANLGGSGSPATAAAPAPWGAASFAAGFAPPRTRTRPLKQRIALRDNNADQDVDEHRQHDRPPAPRRLGRRHQWLLGEDRLAIEKPDHEPSPRHQHRCENRQEHEAHETKNYLVRLERDHTPIVPGARRLGHLVA